MCILVLNLYKCFCYSCTRIANVADHEKGVQRSLLYSCDLTRSGVSVYMALLRLRRWPRPQYKSWLRRGES